MSTQDKILADVIDKLEQKKLNDMKNILKDFTHIQIIFHAKALEMSTTAYKHLLEIDTESDLEEFRNNFTQSTISNLQYSSNKSLNESNRQKNSMDDLFSGGSSTPGRSKNNLDQSRSKSNEPKRNTASTSNLNQKQKNSKAHASAPNLNENKKRNTSDYDQEEDDDEDDEDYDVKDVTDDSDAE